jgi:hypothetical protein
MKQWIICSFIVLPFVMFLATNYVKPLRKVFHALAFLSFYSVGVVLAVAVYNTNSHGTTFTTNVHDILLNPWLLFPGAYLGLYIPYRMLLGFKK